jgi:hypothetical protein
VRYASLTDDQLWGAIAQNTTEMSTLIEQQFALETDIGVNEPDKKADLMRSHLETVNRFQREYRDCTAELRRRYP